MREILTWVLLLLMQRRTSAWFTHKGFSLLHSEHLDLEDSRAELQLNLLALQLNLLRQFLLSPQSGFILIKLLHRFHSVVSFYY